MPFLSALWNTLTRCHLVHIIAREAADVGIVPDPFCRSQLRCGMCGTDDDLRDGKGGLLLGEAALAASICWM